jgi:cytochrome c553
MPSIVKGWVRVAGLAAVLALAGFAPRAEAAGDAQRGKQLGYTCLGCHGIENYKNVYPTYSVPKLVGQSPDYLAGALKSYRSKERSHGTMYAQAASLSDQDIDDIAAYLSGATVLPASAEPRGTVPEKVTALCSTCHGKNGVGIAPIYPTLAGQHADYLERALTEYRKGDRKNAIMPAFANQLSEAEIKQVAEYYAAQQPPLKTLLRPSFF